MYNIPDAQVAKRAMKQQDLQSYFELDLLSLVEQVLYSYSFAEV